MDDLTDNNYQSSTKNTGAVKVSQQQSRNELHLTMNINSNQSQQLYSIKQQEKHKSQPKHSQNEKQQNTTKFNMLSVKQ